MKLRKEKNVLGNSASKCLEKIILEHLSFIQKSDPIHTYRRFLENSVKLDVDLISVSAVDERALRLFYSSDKPLVRPKYFNVKSTSDLSHLEFALDARIVILQRFRYSDNPLSKIHDHSIFYDSPIEDAAKSYFFFIEWDSKSKSYDVYKASLWRWVMEYDDGSIFTYSPSVVELQSFATITTSPVVDLGPKCFYDSLGEQLGIDPDRLHRGSAICPC